MNEERQAEWCGTTGRSCIDCRGSTDDISIFSQCADRIMCPNLAIKLIELYQMLQTCIGYNRKSVVIVLLMIMLFSVWVAN